MQREVEVLETGADVEEAESHGDEVVVITNSIRLWAYKEGATDFVVESVDISDTDFASSICYLRKQYL